MSADVCCGLLGSVRLFKAWRELLKPAEVCRTLQRSAEVFWGLLGSAGVWRDLQGCIRVRLGLEECAGVC